jgi:hypothetical protein
MRFRCTLYARFAAKIVLYQELVTVRPSRFPHADDGTLSRILVASRWKTTAIKLLARRPPARVARRSDEGFALFDWGVGRECRHNLETTNGCEIRQGATTFNVGISYFQSSDFPAAMHHFELAHLSLDTDAAATPMGLSHDLLDVGVIAPHPGESQKGLLTRSCARRP